MNAIAGKICGDNSLNQDRKRSGHFYPQMNPGLMQDSENLFSSVDKSGYSYLRATIGSMREARRAGR